MTTRKANPAMEKIRKAALAYPETREDHPWGEIAIKVKGKVFVFLGAHDDGRFGFSVKLPKSGPTVLKKKFAEPTHYGLGKHGWVSCAFTTAAKVPMNDALAWLDESFRAVAPKSVVRSLALAPLTRRGGQGGQRPPLGSSRRRDPQGSEHAKRARRDAVPSTK